MLEFLRDPLWQFVGAIVSILILLFTFYLEWPRVRERLAQNRSSGAIIFIVAFIGSIVSITVWILIKIYLETIIGPWVWMLTGLILSLIFLAFKKIQGQYSDWAVTLEGIMIGLAGAVICGFFGVATLERLGMTISDMFAGSIFWALYGYGTALVHFDDQKRKPSTK